MVGILVLFYFLLIRPQSKRAKEQKQMVEALQRGDEVITNGGIVGKVTRVKEGDAEIEVEIAENTRVRVVRSMIADVRHPQHGMHIKGRLLFLPGTIGSSSASAILLELVHRGIAPAALVLHEPDAILLLGLIVAREMGWETPGAWQMDRAGI